MPAFAHDYSIFSKSKVTEKGGLLQMESAIIYQAVQKFIEQQYKNDWFAYFLAPKKDCGASAV